MRPAATPTIGERVVYCRLPGRPRRLCFFSPFNRKSATDVNGCLPHIQLLLERSCCALKKEYEGQHPSATSFSSRSLCAAGSPGLWSSRLPPSINLADSELAQSPWLAVALANRRPVACACSVLALGSRGPPCRGPDTDMRTPTVSVHCSLRRHRKAHGATTQPSVGPPLDQDARSWNYSGC
jgi:hypothetical protein